MRARPGSDARSKVIQSYPHLWITLCVSEVPACVS